MQSRGGTAQDESWRRRADGGWIWRLNVRTEAGTKCGMLKGRRDAGGSRVLPRRRAAAAAHAAPPRGPRRLLCRMRHAGPPRPPCRAWRNPAKNARRGGGRRRPGAGRGSPNGPPPRMHAGSAPSWPPPRPVSRGRPGGNWPVRGTVARNGPCRSGAAALWPARLFHLASCAAMDARTAAAAGLRTELDCPGRGGGSYGMSPLYLRAIQSAKTPSAIL